MSLTGTRPPPHYLHPSNVDKLKHADHVLRRVGGINFDHDEPFDGPHPVEDMIPQVGKIAESLVEEVDREVMAEDVKPA